MRLVIACASALVLLSSVVHAQDRRVMLGGQPAPASSASCIEVEIGGERTSSLECLNQRLEHEVRRVQPPRNIAPSDAVTPQVKLGGFNQAAVRQQYGSNFGKSVVPYRPSTGQFTNPIHPSR